MDAVNEKRVFDLLVQMTGRPNSSQYFLLTPKVSTLSFFLDTMLINLLITLNPFFI